STGPGRKVSDAGGRLYAGAERLSLQLYAGGSAAMGGLYGLPGAVPGDGKGPGSRVYPYLRGARRVRRVPPGAVEPSAGEPAAACGCGGAAGPQDCAGKPYLL